MPVSPTLTGEAAKAVLQAYLDAEQRMLTAVARRIARGIDTPGWAEAKLLEVQQLRSQLQALVDELADSDPARIHDAIARVYNRGSATAATDLTRLGASIDAAFATSNLATVTALAEDTVGRLAATHQAILRRTVDVYRDVIATTAQHVATGTATRRQAAQAALDQWARRGIGGFVDRAGRRWDMASYAEMTLRTAANRAVLAGHTERLTGYGIDLVIVSDSPQECELCRPWEGRVLSITGQTTGQAEMTGGSRARIAGALADAQAAGLFHPGCTHSTAAFVPGLTRPMHDTANPDGAAARQELRRLERGVRGWKRRAAVAITDQDRRRADAKVREWQARIRVHTGATEAKRQRHREQLGAR